MEYVTLNNGVEMPILGFGVYQIPKEETKKCVLDAIKVGFRAIDTAQSYRVAYRQKGTNKWYYEVTDQDSKLAKLLQNVVFQEKNYLSQLKYG